jgi:predicted lactoylglutathione lyase
MKVTEIAFAGLPVTDLKRARQFYEELLEAQRQPGFRGRQERLD